MSNNTQPKPTVGRIVHYVLSTQDGTNSANVGHHRAPMIVRVWSDDCVQLQVFTDGPNDRPDGTGLIWVTSVSFNDTEKLPRTWHWPERE